MKVKEVKEKLIKIFGEEKGKEVYKKLRLNIKTYSGLNNISQAIQHVNKSTNYPLSYLVVGSFSWFVTEEGQEYWDQISKQVEIFENFPY